MFTGSVVRAPDSDRKVAGPSLRRSGAENVLRGQLFVLLVSISVPPPYYCSSTQKVPVIFRKCRRQVTAKHTCTMHMWFWMKWHCKLAHGCVMYTECALRQHQYHTASAMQPVNNAVSPPLQRLFKMSYKKSLIRNHMWQERDESAWEQRIALYKSNQQ